jgi:hypothetical protein
MRRANGRNPETGGGPGNESWVALVMAMIVLDTLAGEDLQTSGKSFRELLSTHRIARMDAEIIYAVRCSLLHGYGLPQSDNKWVHHRTVVLTPATNGAFALYTPNPGTSDQKKALLSVPIFCSYLTERIASEAFQSWDESLVDVGISLQSLSSKRHPVHAGNLGPNLFRIASESPAATGSCSPGEHRAPFFEVDHVEGTRSRRQSPTNGPLEKRKRDGNYRRK